LLTTRLVNLVNYSSCWSCILSEFLFTSIPPWAVPVELSPSVFRPRRPLHFQSSFISTGGLSHLMKMFSLAWIFSSPNPSNVQASILNSTSTLNRRPLSWVNAFSFRSSLLAFSIPTSSLLSQRFFLRWA